MGLITKYARNENFIESVFKAVGCRCLSGLHLPWQLSVFVDVSFAGRGVGGVERGRLRVKPTTPLVPVVPTDCSCGGFSIKAVLQYDPIYRDDSFL